MSRLHIIQCQHCVLHHQILVYNKWVSWPGLACPGWCQQTLWSGQHSVILQNHWSESFDCSELTDTTPQHYVRQEVHRYLLYALHKLRPLQGEGSSVTLSIRLWAHNQHTYHDRFPRNINEHGRFQLDSLLCDILSGELQPCSALVKLSTVGAAMV